MELTLGFENNTKITQLFFNMYKPSGNSFSVSLLQLILLVSFYSNDWKLLSFTAVFPLGNTAHNYSGQRDRVAWIEGFIWFSVEVSKHNLQKTSWKHHWLCEPQSLCCPYSILSLYHKPTWGMWHLNDWECLKSGQSTSKSRLWV